MRQKIKNRFTAFTADESGQMNDLPGVIIMLIIAGAAGFAGIYVMSDLMDVTSLSSGDPLYNASQSLQDSVNSAFGMIGIAFIVAILSVVLFYLYGLRGGR